MRYGGWFNQHSTDIIISLSIGIGIWQTCYIKSKAGETEIMLGLFSGHKTCDFAPPTTTKTTTATPTAALPTTTASVTQTENASNSFCTNEQCLAPEFGYIGNRLYINASATLTVEECSCICKRDPNCQAWTLQGRNDVARCHIFSQMEEKLPCRRCVSGGKICPDEKTTTQLTTELDITQTEVETTSSTEYRSLFGTKIFFWQF